MADFLVILLLLSLLLCTKDIQEKRLGGNFSTRCDNKASARDFWPSVTLESIVLAAIAIGRSKQQIQNNIEKRACV